MNYPNWAEIPQNPNPNSEFQMLHPPNHSLAYSQIVPDPYQQSNVASHTAFYLPPQPRPPGVDPPYVPPPSVAVTYAPPPPPEGMSYGPPQPQAVNYVQQPSFEAQQGADAVAAAAAAAAYYPDPNVSWVAAIPQFAATPYAAGVSTPNPPIQPQRRHTWKKAPKKTKVVQSAWCEVCKVDCNSKDVLDQHKLGRKHLKNLQKLGAATRTISAPIVPVTVDPPTSIAAPPAYIATSTSLPVSAPAPAPAPAPIPTPPSASTGEPIIGPQENPKISKPKSQKSRKKAAARTEDLETKRRKVLEGGAAANSVRACNICNVVCNSDTVFNYHLAGQKHASMAKKHASRAGVAAFAM